MTSSVAGVSTLRFALCNEVLQPLPLPAQCAAAAAMGYDALEVAPFTLAPNPLELTDAAARSLRRVVEDHGLSVSGLHWLLVSPSGLSIVDADSRTRERTIAAMRRLIELCALLGGRYLVHGSPKQRSVPGGATREQALARATECFAAVASRAEDCGVVYCIEPLSTRETDLINTIAEAAAIVDAIGSRAIRTMLDCSAAAQMEAKPIPALLSCWIPAGHIVHVQANDPNRRGPGQGDLAFAPIIEKLLGLEARGEYAGIVAVEPFDYVPDGIGSAAGAIGYLRGIVEALAAGRQARDVRA